MSAALFGVPVAQALWPDDNNIALQEIKTKKKSVDAEEDEVDELYNAVLFGDDSYIVSKVVFVTLQYLQNLPSAQKFAVDTPPPESV